MVSDSRPAIAVTMGDPCGIGPEVTAKALSQPLVYERCRPIVLGSIAALEAAIEISGNGGCANAVRSLDDAAGDPGAIDVLDPGTLDYGVLAPGELSAEAGRVSVEWVLKAGELAASGAVRAIVTAPINKEACSLAGYKDVGHMEIFQRQSGADNVATMLMAEELKVVHLTTHRSLRAACDYVTRDNVLTKIELTHRSFEEWGYNSPRIGVAALNPHASDGGIIGDEEATEIGPAVRDARSRGIDAIGPVPADTVFNQAIDGKLDVVLAMYHDQGHIPIKVHNWAKSVSVNLGLPFIRTSVDHGTAFDIAGRGVADETSMIEAILVAVALAEGKGLRAGG